MGTNKFNFYYHKVIAIQKARKRDYDIFHWEDEAITNGLNNILNNNYEHILTDSFLDYLSHDATMGFNFEHLAEDENSVLYIIFYYIRSIVGQYTFSLDNKDSKFGFVSLLEGDIKQATHDAYQFLNLTTDYKVGNIICCILAYCYMNNNVDRFNEYYTIINNHFDEVLEKCELYNVFDGPDGWYDFIKSPINEYIEKKKVIK